MSIVWQWLTTSPNPRHPGTGHDAGQRGWRLHAVQASDSEAFGAVRFRVAACGLQPRHGWGLDMLIEAKCAHCVRTLAHEAIGTQPKIKADDSPSVAPTDTNESTP